MADIPKAGTVDFGLWMQQHQELVYRAVNNHEPLVKALQRLCAAFCGLQGARFARMAPVQTDEELEEVYQGVNKVLEEATG